MDWNFTIASIQPSLYNSQSVKNQTGRNFQRKTTLRNQKYAFLLSFVHSANSFLFQLLSMQKNEIMREDIFKNIFTWFREKMNFLNKKFAYPGCFLWSGVLKAHFIWPQFSKHEAFQALHKMPKTTPVGKKVPDCIQTKIIQTETTIRYPFTTMRMATIETIPPPPQKRQRNRKQ